MRFAVFAAVLVASVAARADDAVKVHVDGPSSLVLQRKTGVKGLWITRCSGACDREIPAGVYRASDGTARPSPEFTLGGSARRVVIEAQTVMAAKPASATRWPLWLGLGITSEVAATGFFVAGALADFGDNFCIWSCTAPRPDDHTVPLVVGVGLGVVGAVFIVVSLVLRTAHPETHVTLTTDVAGDGSRLLRPSLSGVAIAF